MIDAAQIEAAINKAYELATQHPSINPPPFLLWCSASKRPGLSKLKIFGKVMTRMGKMGIPIGDLPDGQPNYIAKAAWSVISEMVDAIDFDMKVEGALGVGEIQIAGVTSAGMAVTAQNINMPKIACVSTKGGGPV